MIDWLGKDTAVFERQESKVAGEIVNWLIYNHISKIIYQLLKKNIKINGYCGRKYQKDRFAA